MSIFFSVMNQNMGTIFLKMNFGKNPGIMKIQLEREYFMLEKETAKMWCTWKCILQVEIRTVITRKKENTDGNFI